MNTAAGSSGNAQPKTAQQQTRRSEANDILFLKGEAVEDGITIGEYMLLHPRCAVCHWPAGKRGRNLELHHIMGGAGRKNLPDGSNFLTLCCRCHHFLHGVSEDHGGIPPGAILTAKEEEDGPVDTAKLASLRGRKALPYEPCEIPEAFLKDRRQRGGEPWP